MPLPTEGSGLTAIMPYVQGANEFNVSPRSRLWSYASGAVVGNQGFAGGMLHNASFEVRYDERVLPERATSHAVMVAMGATATSQAALLGVGVSAAADQRTRLYDLYRLEGGLAANTPLTTSHLANWLIAKALLVPVHGDQSIYSLTADTQECVRSLALDQTGKYYASIRGTTTVHDRLKRAADKLDLAGTAGLILLQHHTPEA